MTHDPSREIEELKALLEKASITSGAWDALDAADAAEHELGRTVTDWLPSLLDQLTAKDEEIERLRGALIRARMDIEAMPFSNKGLRLVPARSEALARLAAVIDEAAARAAIEGD